MFIRGLRLLAPLVAMTTLAGGATAASAADLGTAPACVADARVAPTVELWRANQPIPALVLRQAQDEGYSGVAVEILILSLSKDEDFGSAA